MTPPVTEQEEPGPQPMRLGRWSGSEARSAHPSREREAIPVSRCLLGGPGVPGSRGLLRGPGVGGDGVPGRRTSTLQRLACDGHKAAKNEVKSLQDRLTLLKHTEDTRKLICLSKLDKFEKDQFEKNGNSPAEGLQDVNEGWVQKNLEGKDKNLLKTWLNTSIENAAAELWTTPKKEDCRKIPESLLPIRAAPRLAGGCRCWYSAAHAVGQAGERAHGGVVEHAADEQAGRIE